MRVDGGAGLAPSTPPPQRVRCGRHRACSCVKRVVLGHAQHGVGRSASDGLCTALASGRRMDGTAAMGSAAPARTRPSSPMRSHGSGGSCAATRPHAGAVGHAPRSRHGVGRCTIRGARSGPPCPPLCCAASPDADAERPLHLLLRRLRNAARRGMRHSVWHHATLAAGSSRRTARQREGCEARGRQAVRQTRDSGPRSQGPLRATKQEINHLHLGGCFRNALLLCSVLHTLVNAMKPGTPPRHEFSSVACCEPVVGDRPAILHLPMPTVVHGAPGKGSNPK